MKLFHAVASLFVIVATNVGVVALGEQIMSCASEEDACLPVIPRRSPSELEACFSTDFPGGKEKLVTHVEGQVQVRKITYPQDGKAYFDARGYHQFQDRYPAAIFMAENEDEIVKAVKCATRAGYQISPRGRGHHYQGLSSMDGYVVIDCSLLCDPENFVLERTNDDWLLPGQKVIGTVQGGSGCTNAVMLAYAHKNFAAEEGAVYAIGTCPSVGITGYTTGGGAGDATPYVGWGADDIVEVKMVLYDGTQITANKDENPDLFWATQGGGSGVGVITSLKTVIVQSPQPPQRSTRKFTFLERLVLGTPDDTTRKETLKSLQNFLYEADPIESSRFGGGVEIQEGFLGFSGIFLGSVEELTAIFAKHGLLNEPLVGGPTVFFKNYSAVSSNDFPDGLPASGFVVDGGPPSAIAVHEFNSYGEAMLSKICTDVANTDNMVIMTHTTGDWCADLNITTEKCSESFVMDVVPVRKPSCIDPEVIGAIVEAAYNPLSFLNRAPVSVETMIRLGLDNETALGFSRRLQSSANGGLLIPKVDIDTLNEIAKIGIMVNHFQHGAPMARASNATAFPWRDVAIMTEFNFGEEHRNKLTALLSDFYGDKTKLQGYYNYMNPIGNPNWRYYYFGDNYARLSEIKAKYDPFNFFGNPQQVEPSVPNQVTTARGTNFGASSAIHSTAMFGMYRSVMAVFVAALINGIA